MNTQARTPEYYRERLRISFAPSAYQCALFDQITDGRGHIVVEAVAGSGKTTTAVLAAKLISGEGLYVAFNKHSATELASRLAGTAMKAQTVHSVGFAAIRYACKGKVEVNKDKYRGIVRNFENEWKKSESQHGRKLGSTELRELDAEGYPRGTILKLVDLARVNLVDFANGTDRFDREMVELCYHHALDLPEDLDRVVFEAVLRALVIGSGITSEIDFTDMIWLPTVHGYTPRRYSWVFVDEAQDLSKAQLAIVRKCVGKGGRMVFVGDRRQAIYGFAGADAASFQRIIDDTGAQVLPLSVCYRCPTLVLDLARDLCPQIEAAPSAEPGVVRTLQRDEIFAEIQEGDMVLCRVNAPLLGLCFKLIADGVAASVRGRDIGQGLCKIVDDVAVELADFSTFGDAMVMWGDEQKAIIARRGGDDDLIEEAYERVNDQVECLRIVFGMSKATTAEGLKRHISDLFDNDRPSVVLSSVHRAKGLEEDRVFIVEPDRLRRPRGKMPWMIEQEKNLHYVALTRAKKELIFVEK